MKNVFYEKNGVRLNPSMMFLQYSVTLPQLE